MQTFTAENTSIGQIIALADDDDAPGVLVEVVQCDDEVAHLVDTDGGEFERFASYPFHGWLQV